MSVAAESHDKSADAEPLPFCDLVMKGGITSGVIYPKLIHRLAQKYRFRNVGGTSAGAIAAGACAAAEYRRRQTGEMAGFDSLKELPGDLGKPDGPGGRSRLLGYFQPHADMRPHFAVLLQALNRKAGPAIVGMLFRMLLGEALLAAVLLLVGAVLLAPLVRSLSAGLSFLPAFALALAALVVVGLAVKRTAAGAPRWQLALIWLGACALLVLGPSLYAGVPWGWSAAVVGGSLLAGALTVWALMIVATTLRFGLNLLRGLHRNGYGLCSGRTADATPSQPGLTDWLTEYFDELAGLSGLADRVHPLTFRDLWGGTDRHAPDAVNFEVMTSAVSQQMIYGIPFRDGVPTLYYDPEELERLFPRRVTDWIKALADRTEAAIDRKGLRGDGHPPGTTIRFGKGTDARTLRPFPRGADLPVVVAVRMSLSFPVLLSAVPLYSVDFTLTRNKDESKRMRQAIGAGETPQAVFTATRLWFSDGGIGSNMPLHMFDSLLPSHPTFAVNLKGEHPDWEMGANPGKENKDGRIYLPEDNKAGSLRHWPPPADDRPLGGLVGFLTSIVKTMQNWRDEIQFPYPGFKDRIVQISQRKDEGGLNLDMPKPAIQGLGDAGDMAAERLIDRFHPSGAQGGAGWENHQTVRLRTFLGVMQPGSAALCCNPGIGHWTGHASTIKYTKQEADLARDFLDGLGKLGGLAPGSPAVSLARRAQRPLAQMRITPKI